MVFARQGYKIRQARRHDDKMMEGGIRLSLDHRAGDSDGDGWVFELPDEQSP